MKKIIALLLVSIMALSLVACGGKEDTKTTEEAKATEEQQLIIDTVNAKLSTEEFANWQSLYKEFTGNEATAPKVTNVTHYQLSDFDGVDMDCYLVTVTSNFGYWVNEEAEQGATVENLYLFIDSNTMTTYDSITTDSTNGTDDTTTEEDRATYLLWMYENIIGGFTGEPYMRNTETVAELTEADLEVINNNLK